MTTEEPTPDEEARLAERAAAIWGDPFSPEAMAEDAKMNAQERTYNDTKRYRRMRDLKEDD